MAVLLFSLSTNHDDRPTCLNTMRCTLSLPPRLYNCITVDMLFNIIGYRIDGSYESWKYMGHTTARDRLAPGRRPSFLHPGVRLFCWCCSTNAIFFSIFHIFLKQLLTRWYNTYFSTTWFYGISVSANLSYPKRPSPLEGPSCPRLPYI